MLHKMFLQIIESHLNLTNCNYCLTDTALIFCYYISEFIITVFMKDSFYYETYAKNAYLVKTMNLYL